MEKNQEFTVSIEDISEDGAGIGNWMVISGSSKMQ